ncbi:MAG TPA: leucine--tRNA ligase [Candidatus Saccharimonadia bacterium]|nr:leucine--tRNA ligase [Candidatus Saccharimonadia bacterium]
MMKQANYDHKSVEAKWAKTWLDKRVYEPNLESPKKKFYNLMMFPYPSAEGLHVGNMYAFSGADIYGRYQRMLGHEVLEPIGLDGFGIHSENYALKVGKHPVDQAKKSQANFYRQLGMIGNGFSWEEALETYDPAYYKWTQWLFIQMFKHGLAYKGSSKVNWCPSCKTVLADEQVQDGKCERCGTEVERREANQWFFKITEYADRLLGNIEGLKWPEGIKGAQRKWIGKKAGLDIDFKIDGFDEGLTIWTSFWETVFGVTFIVLAPEHPLATKLAGADHAKAVKAYIDKALKKTEQERKIGEKEKSGVFTGKFAVNPVNGAKIPIWIADYVLKDVGTGAVMGVPSHDQRDFDFVKKHDLGLIQVVEYPDAEINKKVAAGQIAMEAEGKLINSGKFDGLDAWGEGKQQMKTWMIEQGFARERVNYHLRDWLISRQRYWGPPIPMVHCDDHGWQPVPENQLPVELPYVKDYQPTGDGKSPLEKAPETWLYTECPQCGKKAKRETDVSDTFLDSSWYFLRYPSIHAKSATGQPFDPAITKTWMPVDAYIGGAEHAVLHLLYSRFVTMALKDWKMVDFDEPFPFLFGHGLIIKDGAKMSKSKGNVVNPDEYIEKFGADTLRTYLMFLGPYDAGGDFRDTGIAGMYRWLQKIWKLFNLEEKVAASSTPKVQRKLHQTIEKNTKEMASFKFNTSIAAMMELANTWTKEGEKLSRADARSFLLMLAPFAPFMTEQIFQAEYAGKEYHSIHLEHWPKFDAALTKIEGAEVVVQVNGKYKATLALSSEDAASEAAVRKAAEAEPRFKMTMRDKSIKKVIFVPGRLINFVAV